MIIRTSLPSISHHHYYRDLYQLIPVSTAFHGLIQSTPSFWAFIDGNSAEPFLELVLERSRFTPLTVTGPDRFLERLSRMSKSIRDLSLHVFNIGTETLFRPFPYLEALRIIAHVGTGIIPNRVAQLLSGNAPRLTYVDLEYAWIPGENAVLTGLISLRLTRVRASIQELEQILARSPALEVLWLFDVQFAQAMSPPQGGPKKQIPLLQLRELGLEGVPTSTADALLCNIQLSSACERFEFRPQVLYAAFGEDSTKDSIPLECLKHLSPQLEAILNRCDVADLALGGRTLRLRATLLGEPKLVLSIPEIGVMGWLPWVVERVARSRDPGDPFTRVTAIRLEKHIEDGVLEALDKMRVDEVHVLHDVNADPVIKYLSHPTSGWTMPLMKVLSINGTFNTEMLSTMIRRRYRGESGQKATANVGRVRHPPDLARPANLQHISIRGNDDSIPKALEEIQEIVESRGGSVAWRSTAHSLFGGSDSDLDSELE